jgi:CRISPR-associated protein Csm1
MPVQVFVQAQLLGLDDFFSSPLAIPDLGLDADLVAVGRHRYATLLSEALPLAMLEKLGLSKMLLGSSGGGQFLILLPEEFREPAEALLQEAAEGVGHLTGAKLKLIWGITENLGAWSDVRRRLAGALELRRGTARIHSWTFDPGVEAAPPQDDAYFQQLARELIEAKQVGYDPAQPGRILTGFSAFTLPLNQGPESVALANHLAMDAYGNAFSTFQLAQLATGRATWGVLRGQVDHFEARMRKAESIEDHIQLSVLFQQFFHGEIELLGAAPDYFQRISVLFTGRDGFAVYGPWDALITFAQELHRLFERVSNAHLKELTGTEGKTVTMALALAESHDALPAVYARATESLRLAKAAGRDQFFVLGRAIEWTQVNSAAELKDDLVKIIREYEFPEGLLYELGRFYRDQPLVIPRKGRLERLERPWRFYRRVSNVFGETKDRQLQRLRASVISDFIGKNTAQARLRPAGRVALEWANLSLAPTASLEMPLLESTPES